MDILRTTFAKLNENNYHLWKYKLELILRKEGVWKCVVDPVPNTPNEMWRKSNEDAIVIIGLSVEDSQLMLIKKAKTAHDAWIILKSHFEKDTLGSSVRIMRQICGMKYTMESNISEHIMEMKLLFEKLEAIGEKFSERWLVAMLLSSLPPSFDMLVTALEARKVEELTMKTVEACLIEECERHKKDIPTNSVLKSYKPGENKSEKRCHFCKGKGHFKKDCWKFKKSRNKYEFRNQVNEAKEQEVASGNFCFSTLNNASGWVLDSGATCHISSQRSQFSSLKRCNERVTVANGKVVESTGKGNCDIEVINSGNEKFKITIENVLYIPSFQGNLLSVNRILKKKFQVVFRDNSASIQTKEGKEIAVAEQFSGLFLLRQHQKVMSAVCKSSNCQHYWHKIFGHRDIDAIKEMQKRNLTNGLHIQNCGTRKVCEICSECKMTRKPFSKQSEKKTTQPLDLVHTDVCGPMQTVTPGKKRYFVTFIDDHTRYTEVYLLHSKDEVFDKITTFMEFVKNKFGRYPSILRSDNGGEYTGYKIRQYLESKGIQYQYTVPYCPQQNGIAERKNRTLVEMSRCLLKEAKLPNTFWGEAIMTSNYIQNRVYSRAIDTTPYELWEGRKPDVKHLKIFGSKGYVLIPNEKLRKLDNRSKMLTFVGYDDHSKGYRMVDPETKRITISRDVRFTQSENETNEHIMNDDIAVDLLKKQNICENLETVSIPSDDTSEEIFFESTNGSGEAEAEPSTILRKSTRSTRGKHAPKYGYRVMSEDFIEPKSYNEALKSEQKDHWVNAMKEEFASLRNSQTWEVVKPPEGANIVKCKWTYKIKRDAEGNLKQFKARLVACGYSQKYGTDYDEIFAPVVKHSTLRIILSVAGTKNMKVVHYDIKSAFLNGDLKEDIYMKQPPGFEEGEGNLVCKLRKSIYGLKQSANVWNKTLHNVLLKAGYKQSNSDPCLYTKHVNEEGMIYILVYVDDILIASQNEKHINAAEKMLKHNFETNCLGDVHFYLGLEIFRDNSSNFCIRQKRYIRDLLNQYGLNEAKPSKYPMDPGYGKIKSEKLLNNDNYQKLLGSLLYISVNSRPDISACVSILAQKVCEPTQEDWNELKRILKYLKGTEDFFLRLSKTKDSINLLEGYADANWAADRESRKSNSGYVFLLNGCAVSWSCKKQACVALSSTEAEFIALSETCKEAIWLRKLLEDMEIIQASPTVIYEDNQSCLSIIKEEKLSNRTKHIDTKRYFVKNNVDKNYVICKYCPTENMVADMMTKPLNAQILEKFRTAIGVEFD